MDDPIHPFVAQYGWKGLLIEPQAESFCELKKNYENVSGMIFENSAVSDQHGTTILWKIDKYQRSEWHNGIASLDAGRGDIKFESESKGKALEQELVRTRTLRSIIREYNIGTVNLVILDTEGHELRIISSDGFFDSKPDIIHYEHKHLSFIEQDKCVKLLSHNGYKMFCGKFETTAIRR